MEMAVVLKDIFQKLEENVMEFVVQTAKNLQKIAFLQRVIITQEHVVNVYLENNGQIQMEVVWNNNNMALINVVPFGTIIQDV